MLREKINKEKYCGQISSAHLQDIPAPNAIWWAAVYYIKLVNYAIFMPFEVKNLQKLFNQIYFMAVSIISNPQAVAENLIDLTGHQRKQSYFF